MDNYSYIKAKVVSQIQLTENIFSLTIEVSKKTLPGQFYMIKSWSNELPLMRPVSVFKIKQNSLTFLYKIVGTGTKMFSNLKKGDNISLLGPIGNGFPIDNISGKVALVGGGIGIPPLYETAKALKNRGIITDLYLGYKDEVFSVEDYEDVANNIFVTSESGVEGYKGFITDILNVNNYNAVLTCGPEIMMKKIKNMCDKNSIPLWISMEKRMGCGIGACLVCNCKTTSGIKRCCTEGPVFYGKDLIF